MGVNSKIKILSGWKWCKVMVMSYFWYQDDKKLGRQLRQLDFRQYFVKQMGEGCKRYHCSKLLCSGTKCNMLDKRSGINTAIKSIISYWSMKRQNKLVRNYHDHEWGLVVGYSVNKCLKSLGKYPFKWCYRITTSALYHYAFSDRLDRSYQLKMRNKQPRPATAAAHH